MYSIPSGLLNFKIALESPIVNGSYLTPQETSTPLPESAAGAVTYATSALKSVMATPG